MPWGARLVPPRHLFSYVNSTLHVPRAGIYQVTQLMPLDGGAFQYRIITQGAPRARSQRENS